jgi:hypothetical protein
VRARSPRKKRRRLKNAPASITLRGRRFDTRDILTVRKCAEKFYDFGRTRISLEICKTLRWRQPNGWPKDRACRDALRQLAKRKLIRLPKRLKKARRSNILPTKHKRFLYHRVAFSESVMLDFAKGNAAESQWNSLVEQYHYLGHRVVVGRCIKYLISYKGVIAGAICFSSASWGIKCRDCILRKLRLRKHELRNRVLNNSRFLIIPDLQIPNLASQVLSLASRQVAHDWQQFYSITPLVIETFVEVPRFTGACYKAANWQLIGKTRGFGKSGHDHYNSQLPKDVYLFGLNKKIRRKLRHLVPAMKE